MERHWFKAKRYGYGWYPATWEGWFVMAIWLVALLRLTIVFASQLRTTGGAYNLYWYLPLVLLITGALLLVAWAHGEPAKRRWGDDK